MTRSRNVSNNEIPRLDRGCLQELVYAAASSSCCISMMEQVIAVAVLDLP